MEATTLRIEPPVTNWQEKPIVEHRNLKFQGAQISLVVSSIHIQASIKTPDQCFFLELDQPEPGASTWQDIIEVILQQTTLALTKTAINQKLYLESQGDFYVH